MTRQCAVTKKLPQSGHNVSHSNRKTKRKFRPNVRIKGLYSEILDSMVYIKISSHGMKIVEAKGGFDKYVMSLKSNELFPEMRKIKKEMIYRINK